MKKAILLCTIILILLFGTVILIVLDKEEENMSIRFEEIDSSIPDGRGVTWENSGTPDWEWGQDEFPEISIGQILNKEEAQNVGNAILESIQGDIDPRFEITVIRHDPQINFWRIMYFILDPDMTGSAFHVAIDGNTGQILRMWWD